jgi:hypothetical protein
LLYKRDYYLLKSHSNSISSQGHVTILKQKVGENQRESSSIHSSSTSLEELKVFIIWAISSLVDGVFLILWVFVQQFFDQLVSNLQLFGVERGILIVIQLLFAILTLVPILTHICLSLIRSLKEARLLIWEELSMYRRTRVTLLCECRET